MSKTVVALIGSTQFQREFIYVEGLLSLKGQVVLGLGMFGRYDLPTYNWASDPYDYIPKLTSVALNKIMMADDVFVIDVDGYIGDATKMEIAFAESQNKHIWYWSKVNDDHYFGPYDSLKTKHIKCVACDAFFTVGLMGANEIDDIYDRLSSHMSSVHSEYRKGDFNSWYLPSEAELHAEKLGLTDVDRT